MSLNVPSQIKFCVLLALTVAGLALHRATHKQLMLLLLLCLEAEN